jgi:hypothetical protein
VGGEAVISWIVASHDPAVMAANLGATLELVGGDELVLVENAESIAKAYNDGQARASQPIRCYVHHDVQILDLARLRAQMALVCSPATVGLVGVIGSRDPVVPWWEGSRCGSVVDGRFGLLDYGRGGDCAIVDGLLLATAQTVEWDETFPGWHGYDHDMCRQMLARGRANWCLDDGAELVRHNTTGPSVMANLTGWYEAAAQLKEKWDSG